MFFSLPTLDIPVIANINLCNDPPLIRPPSIILFWPRCFIFGKTNLRTHFVRLSLKYESFNRGYWKKATPRFSSKLYWILKRFAKLHSSYLMQIFILHDCYYRWTPWRQPYRSSKSWNGAAVTLLVQQNSPVESYSFLMQNVLLVQNICMTVGHVIENVPYH